MPVRRVQVFDKLVCRFTDTQYRNTVEQVMFVLHEHRTGEHRDPDIAPREVPQVLPQVRLVPEHHVHISTERQLLMAYHTLYGCTKPQQPRREADGRYVPKPRHVGAGALGLVR